MSGIPRWQHQQDAFEFLREKPAGMLAMEMGCGKSRVALDLLNEWDCRRVLVLCPKSVVSVWPSEAAKHAPGEWAPIALAGKRAGTVADRAESLDQHVRLAHQTGDRALCVLNYEATIREPMTDLLRRCRWDALVMDESHRIKAAGGKASRIASQLCDRVASRDGRRLALTGTPMPHSPLDVYAQYRALDKSIFGVSHALFRARYAETVDITVNGKTIPKLVGTKNLEDLHRRMYTICYRCRADEVLDLPDIVYVTRECELSPKGARAYRQMEQNLRVQVAEGELTAANGLARLVRLQQITGGQMPLDEGAPVTIDEEKASLLQDVLEDLQAQQVNSDEPQPVVVFCRFHHSLDVVHARAAKAGHQSLELSGRRNELKAWQDGEASVLAVQIQSGKEGNDFTRARYAVYYELPWSLGDYDQSRKRLHRPGQMHNVTYLLLIVTGTIDERIVAALAARREVVEYVVDWLRRTK